MDVREVVISEFRETLRNNGIPVLPLLLLDAAEAPFDLVSVQISVDRNIRENVRNIDNVISRNQRIALLEKEHEEQLRKLSRQYALQLIRTVRRDGIDRITASTALNEQRILKAQAGRGCDVYPCER